MTIFKKIFLISSSVMFTACTVTGPAEDKWDEEEAEARITLGDLLGKDNSDAGKLEERVKELESKLEKQKDSSSNTKPLESKATESSSKSLDKESQEYQEYLEFKKYQEWKKQEQGK